MSAQTPRPKLRIITYLSPGVPIELFETILQYLESVLGVDALLIQESRWSGPPADRVDLFTSDDVDMGFMCSTAFLRLLQGKNKYVKLCPAAACHQHSKAMGRRVYFSDVVVHSDTKDKYKTFHDLKGCRWAYNDDISLSGNLSVLAELKRQGTGAAFFGHIIKSGGHLKSIQMVLDHTVDAAAIDSIALRCFCDRFPERKGNLKVVTSLGPLPIYPIVFNSRMPDDMAEKITTALLAMGKAPEWGERLHALHITGFEPSDMSLYDMETEIKDLVKNMNINAAYY